MRCWEEIEARASPGLRRRLLDWLYNYDGAELYKSGRMRPYIACLIADCSSYGDGSAMVSNSVPLAVMTENDSPEPLEGHFGLLPAYYKKDENTAAGNMNVMVYTVRMDIPGDDWEGEAATLRARPWTASAQMHRMRQDGVIIGNMRPLPDQTPLESEVRITSTFMFYKIKTAPLSKIRGQILFPKQ